jgi:isovaleryl-CoA dehydrogenase
LTDHRCGTCAQHGGYAALGMNRADFDLASVDIDLLRKRCQPRCHGARADEIDRENVFPRDLWPRLGQLGLLGITAEPEYGGAGLGYLAHVVAAEDSAAPRAGGSLGAHQFASTSCDAKRTAEAEYLPADLR